MMIRFVLLLLLFLPQAMSFAENKPWVRIDTKAGTLAVMQGNHVITEFSNISIGRGGVTQVRVRGDDSTPLGKFRIAWIKRDSTYYRFFGFNYPTPPYADTAREQGLIDQSTYQSIVIAHRKHRLPPQNTALGGYLGIHGLGTADLKVHQSMNWTNGCIALTNKQIDTLARWIQIGTKVVVE